MDHRTSKRYLTGAKGRVGSFVTDHLWLLEPSLWKEFVTALETILSYRQTTSFVSYQIVVVPGNCI
jgi:nucleoid-associated protein YejK